LQSLPPVCPQALAPNDARYVQAAPFAGIARRARSRQNARRKSVADSVPLRKESGAPRRSDGLFVLHRAGPTPRAYSGYGRVAMRSCRLAIRRCPAALGLNDDCFFNARHLLNDQPARGERGKSESPPHGADSLEKTARRQQISSNLKRTERRAGDESMTTMSPGRGSGGAQTTPCRAEGRGLIDIGLEGGAVDWSVEREGRDHAARRQPGDEGGRLPMACGAPTRRRSPRASARAGGPCSSPPRLHR
jgi:hypothetical protein